MSSAQSSQGSERALTDLIDICKNENEKAVRKIVSKSGSTMYGCKNLDTIWRSTDFMFEPGTSSVKFQAEALVGPDHSFLVTPGGAVETLTGPLSEAHSREHKPDALTTRILHSLQGTPTQLSQPDFLGLVGAVKRAETNASSDASKRTFEAVLGALQSAREAQQASGPGGMFELDLSKMPYSMQPRSDHSWVRNADRDINTLARWALIEVARLHSERSEDGGGPTVEHLKLDHGNLSCRDLFSKDQLVGLRNRMDEVADDLFDMRDVEHSWNPDTVIGWGLNVPMCNGNEDCTHDLSEHDMAHRFAHTLILNHRAQPYRFDVALSTAAEGRALTRRELRDLMPDDLADEYNKYSSISLLHRSPDAGMIRPSGFIASEDSEVLSFWAELSQRRNVNEDPDPKMKDIPTEGYESLMEHVRMIRQGKAGEAWDSRYGSNAQEIEVLSEAYTDRGLHGFEYWLENTSRSAYEEFDVGAMEDSLPPQAYDEWRQLQTANKTGGWNLNQYAIMRKDEKEAEGMELG